MVTPLGGLNGNGEGRAVLACVVCDHLRQVELADLVFRQAEADDAAAFADEQGHLLVGDGGGGEDDVAFVFSVLVVHDKDAPALRTAATAASTRSLRVVVN